MSFGVFFHGLRTGSVGTARSLAFTSLLFIELLKAFSFRSETKTVWQIPLLSNLQLVLVAAASFGLQIWAHHNALLSRFLKTVLPPWNERWLLVCFKHSSTCRPNPAIKLARILLPADFSRGSAKSLCYASAIAKVHGAKIILLHITKPISSSADFGYGTVQLAKNRNAKQNERKSGMAKKLTKSKTAVLEQTFAFKAPAASSVILVGDFTHWQKNPVSLRKHTDGIWRVTVSLAPGEHRYRFLVDGEWRDDPECKLQIPNPFGSQDSVVQVSPA